MKVSFTLAAKKFQFAQEKELAKMRFFSLAKSRQPNLGIVINIISKTRIFPTVLYLKARKMHCIRYTVGAWSMVRTLLSTDGQHGLRLSIERQVGNEAAADISICGSKSYNASIAA